MRVTSLRFPACKIPALDFLFFVLVSVAVCACSSSHATKSYGKDVLVLTGRMHYVNVESGCWQFVADDSTHYEIAGEKMKPLLQEGLRIRVVARELHGTASTCMVGKLMELVDILEIYNK